MVASVAFDLRWFSSPDFCYDLKPCKKKSLVVVVGGGDLREERGWKSPSDNSLGVMDQGR